MFKKTAQNPFSLLNAAWQWLLEAIFPRRCLNCGRWGAWCCPVCLASLTYPRQLHCPDCQTVTSLGEFCPNCAGGHYLSGVWSAQPYGNPIVRNLIKAFKFDGVREVAPILVNLINGLMRAFNLPPAWHEVPREQWCLTPVPLAPRRERQRDFNQSEILAALISQNVNLPNELTLQRVVNSKPQSELKNEADRAKNIKSVYKILAGANIAGRAFILVDDVYTSGATLEECARVLKANGASGVWGLTVAKG